MTDNAADADPCSTAPCCSRRSGRSVKKLNPRHQIHNPVMFVVEVGAVITTIGWINQAFGNPPLGAATSLPGSPSPSGSGSG